MCRLTLVYSIKRKQFILAVLWLFICYILISFQLSASENTKSPISIEDGFGYYQGSFNLVDDGVEIIETPSFTTDLTEVTYDATYNNLAVDLTALDYNDIPDQVYTSNLGSIQNGDYTETYQVLESPYPSEISNFMIPLEALNVTNLYAGHYPSSSGEVSIPINIALSLSTKLNLQSYHEVLGENLEFMFKGQLLTKKIVGVTDGNAVILKSENSSNITDSASIIKYDNYDTIKQLEANYKINILTNEDLKTTTSDLFVIVEVILAVLIYISFIQNNFRLAISYLNNINYSVFNYLSQIPFVVIPLLFFILLGL